MGKRGPLPQDHHQPGTRGRSGSSSKPPVRLVMPRDLEGDAAALWRAVVPKLAKLGLLTPADAPALRDMCECWARLREAEGLIARDGVVITGYRGSQVKHPAVTIAKSYRESLQKYFQKFGLQPADRFRLPLEEDAAEPSLAEVLWGRVLANAAAQDDKGDDLL